MNAATSRPWARLIFWISMVMTMAFASFPASSQEMFAEIKSRGVLRVGAAQAEPWFHKDPASSQWSGVGVSLGRGLADALGVKLELVEVTWGTAIAAIQSNKIDIMPLLDATTERKQAVDFPVTPVLYFGQAVLVRDALSIKTWEDLNNPKLTIAVTKGTTPEAAVKRLAPKANILTFPSNAETVAAFQSGRADACSLFHPPLIMLQQKIGQGKIVLPQPFEYGASSIATRKGVDKQFLDWLDAQIKRHYDSNQIQLWFEAFLKTRGVDPAKVPAVRKELWAL
jgi:polar amino acid transport system substrate-binding protein